MSSAPDTRPLADGWDPDVQDVEDDEDDHNVEGGDDNVKTVMTITMWSMTPPFK